MKDAHSILNTVFGYDSFRPGQEKIIDAVLRGRDVLGIMPTGAGKSLCYQVPALLFPGITLVLSPLISLMRDQVETLNRKNVHAAWLNSSLTPSQLRRAYQLAAEGAYRLIYLSPERLLTPAFLSFAASVRISMLCVDEAHCISQWGEEFRPAYRRIPEFISQLPERPVVCAFTATATFGVRDDIIRCLGLKNPVCMTTGFDRPNLYFEVRHPQDKFEALNTLLKKYRGECGIIYCLTRRSVETLTRRLIRQGLAATPYHAGLPKEERERNQASWLADETPVIVATNAFGMGIDKPDVRFVIHYNMPGDMEAYYQEAGRAGRDGLPSDCILLFHYRDIVINEFFLKQSEKDIEKRQADSGEDLPAQRKERERMKEDFLSLRREKLREMMRYAGAKTCLRAFMLNYFGEHAPRFCGKCSVCLQAPSPQDVPVQKKKRFRMNLPQEDGDLYKHLRALRLRLSREKKLVPGDIFSDELLHRLAASVPVTWFSLFLISGMNPVNCIKYGPDFLTELRAWKDSHS
jgi:ATP-dependent DNA helicase RecQ